MSVPKRFRWPLRIAWVTTVVGIFLAILPTFIPPNVRYDGTLAILTMTLLAVIWYTYFTYQAVHKEEPSHMTLAMEWSTADEKLKPIMKNASKRRLHDVRTWLEVIWNDGTIQTLDRFWNGEDPQKYGPFEGLSGSVRVDTTASSSQLLLVKMIVKWKDDLGEEGTAGPRHWVIDSTNNSIAAIVATENIRRLFEAKGTKPLKESEGTGVDFV